MSTLRAEGGSARSTRTQPSLHSRSDTVRRVVRVSASSHSSAHPRILSSDCDDYCPCWTHHFLYYCSAQDILLHEDVIYIGYYDDLRLRHGPQSATCWVHLHLSHLVSYELGVSTFVSAMKLWFCDSLHREYPR